MFAVEKGVPLPARRNGGNRGGFQRVYPWGEMAVGESFFVAGGDQRRVSTSACEAARLLSARFTVRKVEGGVRCWRVA